MEQDWIDISVPLRSGMVHWPGDPAVSIERIVALDHGDPCNVSMIHMGAHSGTHMDPPLHYIEGGRSLDAMPLDATVGTARVVPIADPESIKPSELAQLDIRAGERILFKTRNSSRCWTTDEFLEDFVFISKEGAAYLAERGVRSVGVDYLSVGGFKVDGLETHQTLLSAGIWIMEGLDLSRVEPGTYELICLPIKVEQSDGAPARAILRPLAGSGS